MLPWTMSLCEDEICVGRKWNILASGLQARKLMRSVDSSVYQLYGITTFHYPINTHCSFKTNIKTYFFLHS